DLAHQPADGALVAHVHPALQALEARVLTLERNDLAVEHGRGRTERGTQPAQLRIPRSDVAAPPALEASPTAVHVGDGAYAVPLDLERVLVLVGREILRQRREHRLDVRGHRLALGILGRGPSGACPPVWRRWVERE